VDFLESSERSKYGYFEKSRSTPEPAAKINYLFDFVRRNMPMHAGDNRGKAEPFRRKQRTRRIF
jgi:hypothetical protein